VWEGVSKCSTRIFLTDPCLYVLGLWRKPIVTVVVENDHHNHHHHTSISWPLPVQTLNLFQFPVHCPSHLLPVSFYWNISFGSRFSGVLSRLYNYISVISSPFLYFYLLLPVLLQYLRYLYDPSFCILRPLWRNETKRISICCLLSSHLFSFPLRPTFWSV